MPFAVVFMVPSRSGRCGAKSRIWTRRAQRRERLGCRTQTNARRAAGDPLAGRLALGVIPTISPYLLPAAAPALRKAYPHLSVVSREEKTADLVRAVREGTLDAGHCFRDQVRAVCSRARVREGEF